MRHALPQRRQSGVSLVEALVAMAIMAIGMLGILGVQSTLRSNADLARQRSEAVRIAQAEIERWRGFTTLASGGGSGYGDLVLGTTTTDVIAGSNADFTRTRRVPNVGDSKLGKTLVVEVSWPDRSGETQSVRFQTLLAGIDPKLPMTLTVPGAGDVIQLPGGRKRGLPVNAHELGGGKSGFIPPGAPTGVAWVFDNVTGLITLCSTTASSTTDLILDPIDPSHDNVTCGSDKAILISGYVRYALGLTQPPASAASAPPDAPNVAPASNQVEVWVDHENVTAPTPRQCYVSHVNPSVGVTVYYSAYYCAVPVVTGTGTPTWTGSLLLRPAALFATSYASDDAAKLKACRYQQPTGNGHYTLQSDPLANQNFLLIRSGDGAGVGTGLSFTCPAPPPDPLPAPPPVYTVPHQPAP